MPANVIASVGGNTVNGATSYRVVFPAGDPIIRRKTIQYSRRRNAGPQVTGRSWEPLEFSLMISAADGATSYATLKTIIEQWFQPWSNTTTAIVAVWHDSTSVSVDAELLELRPVQDAGAVQTVMYEAKVSAPLPLWRKVTPTVSAASPATVTNAGNAPAKPSIALTTTTHKTWRACTVSSVGKANGLTNCPIRFLLSDTAATATNVFVWVNGVPAKCLVTDPGGAGSAVWALVDTDPDGSNTPVDIIYGSGITNPLCGALADPDLFDTTGTLNTTWRWDRWDITLHPNFAGAWVPAKTGYYGAATTYQLTSDGATVVFDLLLEGTSDYDSMYVAVPGGIADGSGSDIANLSRVTAGFGGAQSQAFVRARPPNSERWTTAWSTRANATTTTGINLTGDYVALACGIENDGTSIDIATVTFDDTGTPVNITIDTAPTVTVGVATNCDYYNGTLTVGAYALVFTDTFCPDATLTIDCEAGTITSSGGTMLYNGPLPSNVNGWPALIPGVNTITDGLTAAADTWTHREAFA